MWLESFNLLPYAMTRTDPLFTSLFIAPLGSIGMDSGFHHLFEYGNCPIFVVIGKSQKELVVNDAGQPEVRPLTTLRYTLDERIEDGLYCAQSLDIFKRILENPAEAPGLL
jgi:hypothetical protein